MNSRGAYQMSSATVPRLADEQELGPRVIEKVPCRIFRASLP